MGNIAKVDRNQPAMVAGIRAAGGEVLYLHTLGQGRPDLLVWLNGTYLLVEVKPNEKKVLTDDEQKWHREWPGPVLIACCIEEVLQAAGIVRESFPWLRAVVVYRELLRSNVA